MRELDAGQLLGEGVSLDEIMTFHVREPVGFSMNFDNQKTRRKCSVLFLYHEGRRLYRVPSTGETFELTPGDVLSIPQAGVYSFEITAGGTGADCIRGRSGTSAATVTPGAIGAPGTPGANDATGAIAAPGTIGANDATGANGTPAAPGANGANGANGSADGSAVGIDSGIAVNFTMKDRNGEFCTLGKTPRILTHDRLAHYYALFRRLASVSAGGPMNGMMTRSLLYALLYELLCETRVRESERNPYGVILPAVDLIENDPAADLPIPLLARSCGVSETTFRKLFLLYSGGVSPVEYRNRLRIDLAERILRTEMTTVEYAARTAGFSDLPHFYRLYRKLKGETPRFGSGRPR